MIVSGYITFYQINKCFANILFFIIEKMSLRDKIASWVGWNGFASQIWPAGLSLETPGLQYNWSQVEAKQLPTLHCTVIGLMRERLVALGIPSWTHLRTRYWGVFTLQGLKELLRALGLWYCEIGGIGENEKVEAVSTAQRCFSPTFAIP